MSPFRFEVLVLALAVALLAFAGCAGRPIEHTVQKVPAESSPGTLAKTQEEFQKEFSTRLDKLDAEIKELKSKAATLKDEARAKLDDVVAKLDAKQKAARAKLDEVSSSSAQAWEHLKQGTKAAWEELERAVKDAAKEF